MELDHQNKLKSDLPDGLAKPALRALTASGYTCLEEISKLSEAELKQLHGIGPDAVEKLRTALAMNGLTFSRN